MGNATRVGSWATGACVMLLQAHVALAQSLPAPWSGQDVGAVGQAGSASYANGVFTIRGAGADIWGAADAFQSVLQPVTGDSQIVVRVASVQNTNTFAKAGVMLRATTAADSPHVILDVRPNGSIEFMTRPTTAAATTFLSGGNQLPPTWLKLTRAGNLVTAFASSDGSTWTQVGITTFYASAAAVVGMVVTSRDSGQLNTSTFDNVAVTTPIQAPWVSRDIGPVGLAGSVSSTNGVLTVRGAGADIWGTADAFQSILQPIPGDAQIVVRVNSLQNTNTFAKAGVMLRSATTPGAADVIFDVRPNGALEFMTRPFAGAATSWLSSATQGTPAWLKLTRVGTSVTGYVSANGTAWTQVGTTNMGTGSALLGLAVTSHDATKLTTAVFDNLTAGALVPPTATPFNGIAMVLPGTLATENFDNGGEGVAFHDTSSGNSGGQYRATDVDLELSSRGGVDIGWIADGEWLNYSVNVATTGRYQLQFAVSSLYASGRMHATFGGTATGTISIPNTGSWQSWTTVSITADLTAGPQTMKLVFDSGSFNLAGMTAVLNPPTPPALAPVPLTPQPPAAQPPAAQPPAARAAAALSIAGAHDLHLADRSHLAAQAGAAGHRRSGIDLRGPGVRIEAAARHRREHAAGLDGRFVPNAVSRTADRVGHGVEVLLRDQHRRHDPRLLVRRVDDDGDTRARYGRRRAAAEFLCRAAVQLDEARRDLRHLRRRRSAHGVSVRPGGRHLHAGARSRHGRPGHLRLRRLHDDRRHADGEPDDLLRRWLAGPALSAPVVADRQPRCAQGHQHADVDDQRRADEHPAQLHAPRGDDRPERALRLPRIPTAVDLAAPRYASQVYVWDTTTDVITPITAGGNDGGPNALPGGHGAAGFGVCVNQDCCTSSTWDAAQWQFRSLATPLVTHDLITPVLTPKEVYLSDHTTWANAQPNSLVPVIAATYRYGLQNTAPWRAWDDEIIAIQTTRRQERRRPCGASRIIEATSAATRTRTIRTSGTSRGRTCRRTASG